MYDEGSNEVPRSMILEGARKLLLESLHLSKEDELVIVTPDRGLRMTEYILKVSKELGIDNTLIVKLPELLRPYRTFPDTLRRMISKADAVILMLERMSGSIIADSIQSVCDENSVKYTYVVDPEPRYLGTGINADYAVVEEKTMRIGGLCSSAKEIHLTSRIGSNVRFTSFDFWVPCVPELTPRIKIWNQHPEGEAQMCPVEETFTGRIVTRGPFRYAGQGLKPIILDYDKGQIVNVEGDAGLQNDIMRRIKELDDTVDSLIGVYVGEFAVGSNDWAVFDDNVSNCEKVSGTVHFAMGSRDKSYMEKCRQLDPEHPAGKHRGEKYHLDYMIPTPTLVVTDQNGQETTLIEEGHLLI